MDRAKRLFGGRFLACARKAAWVAIPVLLAGCGTPAAVRQPPVTGTAAAQARGSHPGGPAALPSAAQSAQPAPAPADTGSASAATKKSAAVRVFYATDRSRSAPSDPAKPFGGKRGPLSYGSCEVALPREAKPGGPEAVAAPRNDAKEQPDSRPALRRVTTRDYEAYLESLKAAISTSARKSAFVFVHGYNVTFADAARRTAQLKHDLGFDGAAIFFSWPSKGRADAYPADQADIEWAQPDLKEFLKELAAKSRARNIYLIAHGMGNRALTKAYIYLISERPELKKAFREVILVAPDIDADLFKRDIAPALAASSNRTTLYVSSRDSALKASNRFQDYPRAGDAGANLFLFDGIETIDATNVNTTPSGRASLADNASVLADMHHLIRDGKGPAERSGLQTVHASSGRYWKFKLR